MTKYTEWKEYQFRINLENEKLKRRESLKTGMTKCSKIYNTQNVNIKEPSRLSKAVTYLFSIDNVVAFRLALANLVFVVGLLLLFLLVVRSVLVVGVVIGFRFVPAFGRGCCGGGGAFFLGAGNAKICWQELIEVSVDDGRVDAIKIALVPVDVAKDSSAETLHEKVVLDHVDFVKKFEAEERVLALVRFVDLFVILDVLDEVPEVRGEHAVFVDEDVENVGEVF